MDERCREQREKLAPILAQLDAMEGSTFLYLCELVLMLAERSSGGMLKFTHPRITVHIKHPRKTAERGGSA